MMVTGGAEAVAGDDGVAAFPVELEPAPRLRVTLPSLRPRPRTFPRWLQLVDAVHGSLRARAAVIADGAVVAMAGLAAGLSATIVILTAAALLVGFNAARVYAFRTPLETQGLLWYPSRVASPFALVYLLAAACAPPLGASVTDVIRFSVFAASGLMAMRGATWAVVSTCRRSGTGLRRTLVVGSGDMARTVLAKLEAFPEVGLMPVGILSPDGRREAGAGVGTGALPADLPSMIVHRHITHVILVPEGNQDVDVATCLELCDGLDVSFSMLPPLADMFLSPRLLTQVGGLPLITLGKVTRSRRVLPGKRMFDVVAALALLIIASPLMVVVAFAVKLGDRGPLLFKQDRVGQGGRVFQMLKFRSMVVNADQMMHDLIDLNITDGLLFKMADDPRVTRVGRVIRRLSLDELPQLWNVVRGDMSLVGPRPLPVDPDDFGVLDGKRHSVPPGITGYWQIAGGTGLSYQEMVKLDLAYIQNWSLWLDLRLLLRTLPFLLTRHHHGAC